MPHSSDPIKNAAYMRKWRQTPEGKAYFHKYNRSKKRKEINRRTMIKRYGITVEQYDERFAEQAGGCAICGKPPGTRYRLSIDHNHTTGQARGLLCQRCNVAIAVLESEALSALEAYLKKWNSIPLHHGVTSAAAEVSAHST